MTFSLKGLKTITNYQYEPACGILSLLDIFYLFKKSCKISGLSNVFLFTLLSGLAIGLHGIVDLRAGLVVFTAGLAGLADWVLVLSFSQQSWLVMAWYPNLWSGQLTT